MIEQSKINHNVYLVIIGLAAWIVPGGGHFLIKEKKRALIIFAAVTVTFLLGIYIGSIGVVTTDNANRLWYTAQMLATPFTFILGKVTAGGNYPCLGKPFDIGQIYTAIAGTLNLLCMISAVYMAHCGRGEMIGHEEDENVSTG